MKKRFVTKECKECSKDRKFNNGLCVYNQNLGFAYSVDEIVEVLNQMGVFEDYLMELLQAKIWYCQINAALTGNDKYTIEEECLKKLRNECHDENKLFEYNNFLNEHFKKRRKNNEK